MLEVCSSFEKKAESLYQQMKMFTLDISPDTNETDDARGLHPIGGAEMQKENLRRQLQSRQRQLRLLQQLNAEILKEKDFNEQTIKRFADDESIIDQMKILRLKDDPTAESISEWKMTLAQDKDIQNAQHILDLTHEEAQHRSREHNMTVLRMRERSKRYQCAKNEKWEELKESIRDVTKTLSQSRSEVAEIKWEITDILPQQEDSLEEKSTDNCLSQQLIFPNSSQPSLQLVQQFIASNYNENVLTLQPNYVKEKHCNEDTFMEQQ
ncbi:hypothetical protein RFI_11714 [Reticulomyxa filosa]|uniref:Uncharacterized protein n=1 Tax=Reticulomyxa filosa TaxID=46433 RepID=X6NI98_RETFI|nr:hypothetical protein RFI_11714 [Reticulomyxa filosa]|eukprot:ETO25424.1 hypothetical protein RFI_11714 [Reticulomyxa filosa]